MSVSPDMNPMQRARSGTVSLQRKRRDVTRKAHGHIPDMLRFFSGTSVNP